MTTGNLDITLTVELNQGAGRAQIKDVCFVSFPHEYSPIWMNAGIYHDLYFSHGKTADCLIHNLSQAMIFLKRYQAEYQGKYPNFNIEEIINQIDKLLFGCSNYPNAKVAISK